MPFYRFVLPCVPEYAGNKRASLTFIVGKSWLLTVSGSRPKFTDSFVETDRGEKVE